MSVTLKQTPSQTVGPYFAYGLLPEQYGYEYTSAHGPVMCNEDEPGEHIRVLGRVLDGAGKAVNDAMIELWQADAQGRYAHPADPRGKAISFKGVGRCGTGTTADSHFRFETVKPGAIGDGQAPHINVIVTMRGMLSHAYTRIYFSDEADANAGDPVLNSVPAERRKTLLARREEHPGGVSYRFDIRMQGAEETVFFDV